MADDAGDSPYKTIPGTNIKMPEVGEPHEVFRRYTPEQFALSSQRRGARWYEEINMAVLKAFEEQRRKINHKDPLTRQAELDAVMRMMEEDFGVKEPSAEVEAAWREM